MSSQTSTSTRSSRNHHWGYDDNHGPNEWPKHYPTGKSQSPINILVGRDLSSMSAYCCANDCIPSRMESRLKLCDSTNNNNNNNEPPRQQVNHLKRHHLDSVGEDSRRSPSSASNDSSSHKTSDSDDEDSDEYGHENRRCKQTSVVDCRKQNTRYYVTNKKIFIGYPRYLSTMQLCNTGHNWQINFSPEISTNTLLCGPPFGDREYRLAQLHCHWGEDCDHGSEHQINGNSFAAEIHFVHWNCSQFRSSEEASRHKHGLAVLGVLIQAVDGEQNRNKHLDKIIKGLPAISEPDTSTSIDSRLDLKKLFPTNRWVYASYEGSLTTPPLSEVVDWVVFLNPIQCSTSQIEEFRKIHCPTRGGKDRLLKNCRPVQPLNDRTVGIWTHH